MVEPLYTKIRDDLLAKIEDGTYPPGSVLPSELELAETYDVSRPTIRQALAQLADSGVVDRRRRRGTVVADRRNERHYVSQIEEFAGQLPYIEDEDDSMTNQVLAFRREPPREELLKALELPEGVEEVYLLMRLRSVDGVPQVIATSSTPVDLYPDLMDHDFSVESLYQVMAEAGHPIQEVERRITVAMPGTTASVLLGIDLDVPCFVLDSVGRSLDGRVVEVSHVLYRGDTNAFTVRLRTGLD